MTVGTASQLTAVLDSWVAQGIVENPPGSNKTPIGEEFGWNGVAWCCETMSVAQTRVGLNCFHEAAVVSAVALAKKGRNGMEWIPANGVIREGDMSCFQWADGSHHISYVRDAGTQVKFQTDSGNEHDRMYRQWRDRTYVMGFIRLPYASVDAQPQPESEEDDDMQPFLYRVSVDDQNSKTADGDNAVWCTPDRVTTYCLTGDLFGHGKNLGFWPKGKSGDVVINLVPIGAHAGMLANTQIQQGEAPAGLSDADAQKLADKILAEESKRLGVKP